MNLEKVLCVPTSIIEDVVPKFNATIENASEVLANLLKYQAHCVRDDGNGGGCENDERLQQLIPYVAVFDSENRVLCYQRKGGGEKRLDAKLSIGIGGHTNDQDHDFYCGVSREIEEEVEFSVRKYVLHGPIGFIRETDNPVGRVHIGVLYKIVCAANVYPRSRESDTTALSAVSIISGHPRLERWSQIAIDMLTGE